MQVKITFLEKVIFTMLLFVIVVAICKTYFDYRIKIYAIQEAKKIALEYIENRASN